MTFDREHALETISDLSKDATGCRLRLDWAEMDDEKLQSWQAYFRNLIDESIEMERREAPRALAAWKDHIDQMVRLGAGDVKTAIRWDIEAMCAQDVDHYCYLHGLMEKPDEVRSFR